MMHMKGNENVQPFISRMIIIVNQMKSYGDHISESTIVAKVLQSLTPLFDHVLMVIEESKDLTTLSVEELSGSLQAHEVRINRFVQKAEEHAFHTKDESNITKDDDKKA